TPSQNLQALRSAASAHQALPFIYGNGYHRGMFVIVEIDVDYKVMSDQGDLIYIVVSLGLKEYQPDVPIDPNNPDQTPDFIPPAIVYNRPDLQPLGGDGFTPNLQPLGGGVSTQIQPQL